MNSIRQLTLEPDTRAWLMIAQLSDRARLARLDVLHGRQVARRRQTSPASGPRLGAQGAQAYPHLEPLWIQAVQHVRETFSFGFQHADKVAELRTSILRGLLLPRHAPRRPVSFVSIVYIRDESRIKFHTRSIQTPYAHTHLRHLE